MSTQFESKRYEIEKKIKNTKRKGFFLMSLSSIILLIVVFYFDLLIGYLPINRDVLLVLLLFPIWISGRKAIPWIFDPINPQEYAFYEIVEALRLLEKGGESETVNKIARKRILNASQKLGYLRGGSASWYTDIKKNKDRFIINLRTRIAPAVLDGKLSNVYLIDITKALLRENISLLEDINNRLEKDLDEIKEDEEINPLLRFRIFSFLFGLQDRAIGKAIICIIGGFGFVALIIWIGISISPEFSIQVNKNLLLVFSSAIALSVGLMALYSREPSIVKVPEQIIFEAVSTQKERERERVSELAQQSARELTEVNKHIRPHTSEFSVSVKYDIITESDWTIFSIDGEEKWEEQNVEILDGEKSLLNPPEIGPRRITLSKNSYDTTIVKIRLNAKMIIPINKLDGKIVYEIRKGDIKWTTVEIRAEDKIVDIFTNEGNIINDSENSRKWQIPVEKHVKPRES